MDKGARAAPWWDVMSGLSDALVVLLLSGLPADGGASPGVGAGAPATGSPAAVPTVALLWNRQRTPSLGPPQAIGAYAGGCLQGATVLPASGPGYEALHRSRNRFFGHPTLVAFIRRLGVQAKKRHLGVLVVGDMSQARGGPTPSGHRSHQTGLDVDLGYAPPVGLRAGHLKAADRERFGPPAVTDLRTHEMTPVWGSRPTRLLAAAASDPAVDRVFVNPAVRRALCAGPARREAWFTRVRPWWGHHDHFHVRLKCPDDSPLCAAQEPPPADDDGCGATLAWWFSPDAQSTEARRKQDDQQAQMPGKPPGQIPGSTPGPTLRPILPDACAALLPPEMTPALSPE
jgi:penicillin-insensitive murein endopeptidase